MSGTFEGEAKSSDWFFVDDGKRVGPVPLSELEKKYSSGYLPKNTLVWTATFGGDWKELGTVVGASSSDGPPAVPENSIPSIWFYSLMCAPLLGALIETILRDTNPGLVGSDVSLVLLYGVPNIIFALLDIRALDNSGRKDVARGLTILALILAPIYIYLRAKRTGKGLLPVLGWLLAFFAAFYVTENLNANMYMGLGTPHCDSQISQTMVEDIYPGIPLNTHGATVIAITDINEVSFDPETELRTCGAAIKDSLANTQEVSYTITPQDDDYYFHLRITGL